MGGCEVDAVVADSELSGERDAGACEAVADIDLEGIELGRGGDDRAEVVAAGLHETDERAKQFGSSFGEAVGIEVG